MVSVANRLKWTSAASGSVARGSRLLKCSMRISDIRSSRSLGSRGDLVSPAVGHPEDVVDLIVPGPDLGLDDPDSAQGQGAGGQRQESEAVAHPDPDLGRGLGAVNVQRQVDRRQAARIRLIGSQSRDEPADQAMADVVVLVDAEEPGQIDQLGLERVPVRRVGLLADRSNPEDVDDPGRRSGPAVGHSREEYASAAGGRRGAGRWRLGGGGCEVKTCPSRIDSPRTASSVQSVERNWKAS